jgi:transposase InsO family protein
MKACGRAGPAKQICRGLAGPVQDHSPGHGQECIVERFLPWWAERAIELWHIQPRKPDQNTFIERFNRAYRTEALNAYVFESLEQVRKISAGCGAITKSGPMSRWRACRPPRIALNVKPEVLY